MPGRGRMRAALAAVPVRDTLNGSATGVWPAPWTAPSSGRPRPAGVRLDLLRRLQAVDETALSAPTSVAPRAHRLPGHGGGGSERNSRSQTEIHIAEAC